MLKPYEFPEYPVTTLYEARFKQKNNGSKAVIICVSKEVYWTENDETKTMCKSWDFKYAYANGVLLPYICEETLSKVLAGKPVKESTPLIKGEMDDGVDRWFDYLLVPNDAYTFIDGKGLMRMYEGQFVYMLPAGRDMVYKTMDEIRMEFEDMYLPDGYSRLLVGEKRGFAYRNQKKILDMLDANKKQLFCGAATARLNQCTMDYKGQIYSRAVKKD